MRIGLNAGEPIAEEEDLFGTAVILAARIAAKAEGGEILVSDVVRQLVAGKGFLFSDRGDVVLRGFEDPVRLYEVRWREERVMEPQMRFCTSFDGVRIAYATLGEGSPLVNVPSWAFNLELGRKHPNGRAFSEELSRGRLYVTFDCRGVGGSQRDVDDLSLDARVRDVAAVVDHLQLERFDLFGCLDSSAVSIAYAAQHPERVSRMVLWAAYPCGVEMVRPGAVRGLVELIPANWSLARRAIADVTFPSGPTELQRWFSNTVRESMSPETAARLVEFYASVDVRRYLPQVKAPTLVLHRRGDRNAPIAAGREAATLIPDARFVALEGDIGHPYFGDMSYIETVREFLDEGRAQPSVAEPSTAGAFRTVLFTDVEGSTALTQRLGDAKAPGGPARPRAHRRGTRSRPTGAPR